MASMISKFIVAASLVLCGAMGVVCGAEEDSSAPAAAYYQKNLKDRPQGVYEWTEQGLLFVQVSVPNESRDSDDVDGLVSLEVNRELYAWLASKAARIRKDSPLPEGLALARRLVRANFPLWEYTADWAFKMEGQSFSREEGKKRISCFVCRKKDVEASMPEAFLVSAGEDVWLRGIGELVRTCYLSRLNVPFMSNIGLWDGVEIFSPKKFDGLAVDRTTAGWRIYQDVVKSRTDYLGRSESAKAIREALERLSRIPMKQDCVYTVPNESFTTNRFVAVVTNAVQAANAVTNVTEIPAARVVDIVPLGGKLIARQETRDDSIITTVETQLVVRTRRTLVQKVRTEYFAEGKFEKLFLGGGSLPNQPLPRTKIGLDAETYFYAKATLAEHEKVILDALRENAGDKVLWNLFGCVLREKKDYEGALICYRNALRLDYRYQYALVNLALTYKILGKQDLALPAALVAYGLATDDWCKTNAEGLLRQ